MADLRAAGDTGHQVSQQRVFGVRCVSDFPPLQAFLAGFASGRSRRAASAEAL
jgi:hypothetical protein